METGSQGDVEKVAEDKWSRVGGKEFPLLRQARGNIGQVGGMAQ